MKYLSSLKNEDLAGKICLLRIDFNIEKAELAGAKNHPRLALVLPTIKFLIKNGAKVIILSHRGRPLEKSKIKNQKSKLQFKIQKELSLRPFVKILSSLLKKPVHFIDFKNGFNALEISKIIARNSIFLLENLRYFEGEEKNDKNFAKRLASLGDFFVNDAFSVSHRANASVAAITEFLPSYAGFQLEKEIKNLSIAIKKPLVVILGGAKISDKIGLLKNFMAEADYFLIGGGMAHNFLLAQGLPIGNSIFEEKTIGFAKKMLKNRKVILPADYVIKDRKILDIGPKTLEKYSEIIKNVKTIIWNGPMGYFENPKFAKGSEEIAKAIMANKKAFSIIGGGETVELMSNVKCQKSKVFLSTGGGAMLEYLAGKKMPGIEALNK